MIWEAQGARPARGALFVESLEGIMKEISVFIRANGQKTREFVETLSPMLDAFESELILIAGEENRDVGRRHSAVEYGGPGEKLRAFCLAAAEADKVMVVEEGMELCPALVARIIALLREKKRRNIVCDVKSFLNPAGTDAFRRKEALVIHRGVRGLDLDCGMVLKDSGFLNEAEEAIADGVRKLMAGAHYGALAKWYAGFVRGLPECGREAFRDALERFRAADEPGGADGPDEMLIRADEGGEYAAFLRLRGLVRMGGEDSAPEIIRQIQGMPSSGAWNHRGWLTREFLLQRGRGLKYLAALDGATLGAQTASLLKEGEEFLGDVNRFLLACRTDAATDGERAAFGRVAEGFIDHLQARTEGPEAIKRLVSAADCLLDNALGAIPQDSWLAALAKAKALNAEGRAGEAVRALEEAVHAFPGRDGVLRHCIQKLRYQSGTYPVRLSICMIVRNEEKNLVRCLESLKPLTESDLAELIVVDTGSTDHSAEIASGYARKALTHPWSGSFSEARNFSIQYADGEYVLIMDADEEIVPEGIRALERWFSDGPYREYQTCTLRLVSFTDVQHTQYAVMAQPRLFKNTGLFCYSSAVHNQPVCQTPATSLDIDVLHYGYIMTDDVREAKFRRTATLLKRELQKNPDHLYYRYQLSTSYAMYGDMKEAARQVALYMRAIKSQPLMHDIVLMYYNNAASIYLNCHKYDEVGRISDAALAIQPDFIDFLYYKACILFAGERYETALPFIDRYLGLIDSFQTHDIAKDGRFAFYTVGCGEDVKQMHLLCNARTGRDDLAIPMAFALKDDGQLKNCLFDWMRVCFRTRRYQDLARLYAGRIDASADPHIRRVFFRFLRAFLARADAPTRMECVAALTGATGGAPRRRLASALKAKRYETSFFSIPLVGKLSFDSVEFDDLLGFFSKAAPLVLAFDVGGCGDMAKLCRMKRLAALVLHRAEKLLETLLSAEEIASVYSRYMEICAKLLNIGRPDLLEAREKSFISKMLSAFEHISSGRFGEAAEDMRHAAMDYHSMDGFLRFAMGALIPSGNGAVEAGAPGSGGADRPDPCEAIRAKAAGGEAAMTADEILALTSGVDGKCRDREILALKASALMLRGRLEEAGACLDGVLKRFPSDFDLLVNLYGLHMLRQDRIQAVRAYARLRMLDPSGARLPAPLSVPAGKPEVLRVLHGAMDLTPRAASLAGALRDRGVYARSVNYAPQALPPYPDYALDVNAIDSGGEILAETAEIASMLISEFDVFHFHYGTTLTFNHFDLIALAELGKKVVMHYWNRDPRGRGKNAEHRPICQNLRRERRGRLRAGEGMV